MHRCNFIILVVGTVLRSLIVSIIQTSKLFMDLYFQNDAPDS